MNLSTLFRAYCAARTYYDELSESLAIDDVNPFAEDEHAAAEAHLQRLAQQTTKFGQRLHDRLPLADEAFRSLAFYTAHYGRKTERMAQEIATLERDLSDARRTLERLSASTEPDHLAQIVSQALHRAGGPDGAVHDALVKDIAAGIRSAHEPDRAA